MAAALAGSIGGGQLTEGSLPMKIMPTYIEPRAAQVELGYPDEQPARLKLEVPFGTIDLKPGAGGSIVSGHVIYNIAELKPTYSVKGRTVRIRQDYRVLLPIEGRNRWEMNLGTAEPYGLEVKAGAASAEIDLSGVPLSDLSIESGAGELRVYFNDVNPTRLVQGSFQAGAGKVVVDGLLNANFEKLRVKSGAGQTKLYFTGGALADSASVKVDAGVGEVILVLEASTPVRVQSSTGLGSTDADESLIKRNGGYETEAYADSAVKLDIRVSSGVGAVRIDVD
jgi:hypothetical protein